ncbi:MAG: histidine--tRNA ligase [Gammaproteobacteria bacterium RIFCSPHIGHO2_12_FULL_37_34]|nr:MAG: histidine--tRNA ligase [Gammaproteobacteria bacterium RIFCSPHIGHO2_12_FULL_37_34]
MSTNIQAIRGMNDILPPETYLWHHVETIMRRILQSHGYQEIRFPILEYTELFKRSIGEITDIVEKEMYTFLDRNQETLTLRPEGTASCVRAGIEHGLLYNQIQRLWYMGPFFRHERPQKGRYRQFHQCSAEVFGLVGPDIDAELILMSALILEKLGIKQLTTLQINSLGTALSRTLYRKELIKYFNSNKNNLDEDSAHRLHKNPMRILDSKNPEMKKIIENAPKLLDYIDQDSRNHFEKLQEYLTHAGMAFEINPCLVRGLDYYTKTVFEWTSDKLGAQATVCGGGRYDHLVEQLGGKPTPALGCSFGLERTVSLVQQTEHNHKAETILHAYLITDSEESFIVGLKLANYLRSKVPGLKLILHCGGGHLKNQFKKADKSEALYAIIIGEHERKTHSVSIKSLREPIPQQTLYQDELAEYLKLKIAKKG